MRAIRARSNVAARHRAYRWSLWLYPAAFRREFRDELLLLADELSRDRQAGALRRLLVLDLAVSVPRTRWESIMRSSPTPTQLLIALTVLTGAALTVLLGLGLGSTGTIAGFAIVLVGVVLALSQRTTLARAFEAPRERTRTTARAVVGQAWWAPLAALHGLATLVFAVAVAFQDDGLWTNLIGFAIGLAFAAAVLGGIVVRVSRPALGSALVMIGSLGFGLAFWLVWPPIVLAIIWVGVITSARGSERGAPRPV